MGPFFRSVIFRNMSSVIEIYPRLSLKPVESHLPSKPDRDHRITNSSYGILNRNFHVYIIIRHGLEARGARQLQRSAHAAAQHPTLTLLHHPLLTGQRHSRCLEDLHTRLGAWLRPDWAGTAEENTKHCAAFLQKVGHLPRQPRTSHTFLPQTDR